MDAPTNNNKPHLPVKPKPPPSTATATATVFFGGCFGCSNRNSVAIIKVAAPDHHSPKIIKEKHNKKHKPWFPNWSMKNSPTTVPLDAPPPAAESNRSNKDADHRKSTDFPKSMFIKWKINSSKKSHHTPTEEKKKVPTSATATAAVIIPPSPTPKQSAPMTESSPEQNNIAAPNGSVSANHGDVESSKGGTCKKRLSFCRKRVLESGDKTKTGSSSSLPGSPVSRPKPNPQARNSGQLAISRSTTFPAPDQQVQPIIIAANNNNDSDGNKIGPVKATAAVAAAGGGRRKQKKEEGKLDSVVGLSIIAVTLVIMVVWGRFCAVVCTAAWLYFVPRLRTSLAEVKVKANHGGNSGSSVNKDDDWELGGSGSGSGFPDLDSVEYKRRVVLEGLLERNRRSVA